MLSVGQNSKKVFTLLFCWSGQLSTKMAESKRSLGQVRLPSHTLYRCVYSIVCYRVDVGRIIKSGGHLTEAQRKAQEKNVRRHFDFSKDFKDILS